MKKCRITNCHNSAKGKICSTHRYRWNMYKSYDLPDYIGMPNYLTDIPLPHGYVKRCKTHGDLKREQTYIRFYKGKESSYYCKECLLSHQLTKKYKNIYGMKDYEEMLIEQDNKCKMCKITQNNTTRNGKIKRFNIDHCHKTGKVRGLLCSFCNSLLGYSNDSIEILESAITYLKENS